MRKGDTCMQGTKKKDVEIDSSLPVCVLKDTYRDKKRESIVRMNDNFRPNGRVMLKAIRDILAPEYGITPYHCHEGIEILCINEGSANVVINNHIYPAEAGDIVVANPFEAHGIYVLDSTVPMTRTCITFHPHYLFPPEDDTTTFFTDLKNIHFQNHIRGNRELCDCLENIVSLCQSKEPGWAVAVFAKLTSFYALIVQNGLYTTTTQEDAYLFVFMKQVSAYIEENLDQDITTAEIAAACRYTTEHFCRLFKKCFGKTFKDYLNIYRIQKAKAYIDARKHTTIAATSSKFGFNNQNHFSRMFKKYTGMLPSEYINRR